jgi:OOP family OmpA-OmpF porin
MKKWIFAAAALCCAVPAMAGDAYVGAAVGKSHLDANHGGYFINQADNEGAYKLFGGYQFTPSFGAEIGYADLGRPSIDSRGNLKFRTSYAAATGTLPLSESLSLSGKLGIAATRTTLRGANFGGSESQNRASIMTGVGLGYALTEKTSVVVEYENFGRVAKKGVNAHAEMLSAGLRMKF